jgi:chromosome segregation ATPase
VSDSPVLAALARLEAGQTRLEAGYTRLEAGYTRLEAGATRLEADLTGLKAEQTRFRSDFLAELGRTRADIMERVDRLENAVTLIRDDIAVNMGAADAVERANENTRADVRTLGEQVSVMWKQIKQLQSEMREVRGDP